MTMRGTLGTRRLLERAGQKATIDTTTVFASGSGRLNPEQADRFIDYIIEQTVLFKDGIRVRRMNADRADLDKLQVGTRIIRKAAEGVEPGTIVGVTTAKRQLVVTEIILPADVTFTFFEDNIERDNFEDHLMQGFGTQLGNDLEDLAINGDVLSGDAFIQIEDGWVALMKAGTFATAYDTNGSTDFRNVVFEGMLEALPAKFKGNKGALRFYVSTNDEEKYRFQLGQRQTAGGDQILMGDGRVTYSGVPVVGAPYMPDGTHFLTMPDNLVFGVRRDISLGIFRHERKRVYEYTWTLRVDFQVVEGTAAVIGYNVP
jgi:hypothetical protein